MHMKSAERCLLGGSFDSLCAGAKAVNVSYTFSTRCKRLIIGMCW